MKPFIHAAEGDERIRTAVPSLGTDWAYEALAAGERKRHELYGDLLRGKVGVKEYVAAVMQAVDEVLARAEADRCVVPAEPCVDCTHDYCDCARQAAEELPEADRGADQSC